MKLVNQEMQEELESTSCSSRGPGFDSQHPHRDSGPSRTPVLKDLTPSSGLHGHQAYTWYRDTDKTPNTYSKNKTQAKIRDTRKFPRTSCFSGLVVSSSFGCLWAGLLHLLSSMLKLRLPRAQKMLFLHFLKPAQIAHTSDGQTNSKPALWPLQFG